MRLILAAVLLAIPCLPAHAQIAPSGASAGGRMPGIIGVEARSGGDSIGLDVAEARQRIKRGRQDGDLSRREARGLRREADQIETLSDRYGRDGLSDSERRELEMRAGALRGLADAKRIQGKGAAKR